MNINDYKDFKNDLSTEKAQDFLTLSVEKKLEEFQRIHTKYLGDYKYMYFLPQSGNWRLTFERKDSYTRYLYIDEAFNLEWGLGDKLEKTSNYFMRKYRKSLEKDESALIYRYSRMYLAISRNKYNYEKYKRFSSRWGF
tara:strand:+ start:23605 stop:24021 length:417 start_codon:yes stop_codon:yes gene_type:complete